ncbi:MAG TPA: hypothetical protein VFX77_01635 [Rubrobacter sp.]|nr:hypothetical protein [Rubrobacter sp.]
MQTSIMEGATPSNAGRSPPSAVAEYVELIGPLSDPRARGDDPADAIDLVIPHLPGFGFSGPTTETGWNAYRTARAWAELMKRLGYERYAPTETTLVRSSPLCRDNSTPIT